MQTIPDKIFVKPFKFSYNKKIPLTLACGVGIDSVAMIVGMVRLGIKPDLILFADTGAEKPETYAYIEILNAYLRSNDFPEVIVVKYKPVRAPYDNLEDNCLINGTLPSLAFGGKSCSLKFKAAVQHTYIKTWHQAMDCWKRGEKVIKLIGYDASKKDSNRITRLRRKKEKKACETGEPIKEDPHYTYRYPLQEWGWDRLECIKHILGGGLPLPIKSACFFCPATRPEELSWLYYHHPDLFMRAIELEVNAKSRGGLKKIEGLWRSSTKARPGSWYEWSLREGYIREKEDGGYQIVPPDMLLAPTHPDLMLAYQIDAQIRESAWN